MKKALLLSGFVALMIISCPLRGNSLEKGDAVFRDLPMLKYLELK